MLEALNRRNHCIVMTGDGVNDNPNLKLTGISIAMGSGSYVAKESSDIMLTNDNFTSILNAANINFVISLLTGLAFKDNKAISVFLSTPVEIIRMLPETGAVGESGLGFETAVPDILNRLPRDLTVVCHTAPLRHLQSRVYARYGRLRAGSVLGSFTTVIFGFGDGNLGLDCNNACWPSCHDVFHALATAYTAMMWIFLLFSRKLRDFRRSFFDMHKGIRAWGEHHLWGNWFLLFAITVVFFTIFPTPYIPRPNTIGLHAYGD
ncbi:hypothetical protein Trihar35433_5855 [Trichoderma harzianum]|nr:hypothetical protein Trihar35433_5855 [Trichoderma harzianum]